MRRCSKMGVQCS